MMITGFILSILGMLAVLLGFVLPRYYDVFIPMERRDEDTQETALNQPMDKIDAIEVVTSEGDEGESGGAREKSLVTGAREQAVSLELRQERAK